MNRKQSNSNKLQELRNALLSSLNNVRKMKSECIVAPILDGLVQTSNSLGRQGKFSDFAQLCHKYSSIQNSPSKKLRFRNYRRIKEDDDLVQFRMDRKTTENAEHDQDISGSQYEIPTDTSGPSIERTFLVVTLKLKRLSINKPKGIIEQEERAKRYEEIQRVLRMLKGPQTEKEIIFDYIKKDVLSRISDCAVFRSKVRQYRRQKNEETLTDEKNNYKALEGPPQVSEEKIPFVDDQRDAKISETTTEDEINNDEMEEQPPQVPKVDENDANKIFDPFEQITRIVMSIADNAYFRVKVQNHRRAMIENKPDTEIPEPDIINVDDYETSEKDEELSSPPASESIDETSSHLSLGTKMDRFFDSMNGVELESPNSEEVAEIPNSVEDAEIAVQIEQTECQDFSCQIDEPAATKEKGLLITCIPTSLSLISKIAFSMERHGPLESLRMRRCTENGDHNSAFVVFGDKGNYEEAITRLGQSPLGRPWLSEITTGKMATEEEFHQDMEVHVLFPFANKLANAQVRLENKKRDCRQICGYSHNNYGACSYASEEELFERKEQEALIIEEMEETINKLNLTKSESNVRLLLRLGSIITEDLVDGSRSACSRFVNFVLNENTSKMKKIWKKALVSHVLELSFESNAFDEEKLKNMMVETGYNLGKMDYLLKIPHNWNKLINGENVDEPYALTDLRHKFLMQKGSYDLAMQLARSVGCCDLIFRDLSKIYNIGTTEYSIKVAEIIDSLLSVDTDMNLRIEEAIKNVLSHLQTGEDEADKTFQEYMERLFRCFFKDTKMFAPLIGQYGGFRDTKRLLLFILTEFKQKPMTPDLTREIIQLFRIVIYDLLPRHPALRPTALKLSLNVFKALKRDDFMEDVIAICQEEENMLDLIQSIGRQIPIQNLPKITEALKNRYPNLLTQLVKIVLERADAAVVEGFTIEQPHLFDLVCDFGSEEDGRALMKRIFQSQNLPQDKLSHLMLRLKEKLLPRHPILQNDHLQFYIKSFEANPSSFNKEMLSLCQSEGDLRRIIEVIDEKTSFDQTLDDLAIIMLDILSFLNEKPEWINSWKSAMGIIREQFENNPADWSWILTKHAKTEDIQRGIESLEKYITNKGTKHIKVVIKTLISNTPSKWSEAVPNLTQMLPRYFAKEKLKDKDYEDFFKYKFWEQNPSCFKSCLKYQYDILKGMVMSNEVESVVQSVEILAKIVKGKTSLVSHTENFIKALEKTFQSRMDNFQQRPVSNKRPSKYVAMVPDCRGRNGSTVSNRCEGCLRLISFLNAEDTVTYIQVNATLRNCASQCLRRTPPGQTQNLKTILRVREAELTNEQTRAKNPYAKRGNCGSLMVTKLESPEQDVQKIRGKNEEFIRRLNRANFEMKSSNLVVPTLMMSSTSSTSTSSSTVVQLQSHEQRNQAGKDVLSSSGGVRYHKLYSPTVPSVLSRLPDHNRLIPLSQGNRTQFRVCPPTQQSSSSVSSSTTTNTALATPSSSNTNATTSASRPTTIHGPQSDLLINDDDIIFVREETRRNPIQTGPPLKRDATSPFSGQPPHPPPAKRPNTDTI